MKKLLLLAVGALALLPGALRAESPAPSLTLQASPAQEKIPAGSKPQETVIKIDLSGAVRAPDPAKPRTPLNIAVVLDRSGSMSGPKIEQARQGASALLDLLRDGDSFSLVAYDTPVEVIIPAQKIDGQKDSLRQKIFSIQPADMTALHAGVTEGAVQLRKYLDKQHINRVILLSDGLANVGPSTPAELADLGRRLASEGIAVTTIGLGDQYNEDLMTALAQAGDANYHYVSDPEKLPGIFATELGQLASVVARDITITITLAPGVKPIDIIGRDDKFSSDGKLTVTLAPQSSGQTRSLYLRCLAPANSTPGATAPIATVTLSYQDDISGAKPAPDTRTIAITYAATAEEAEKSANPAVAADVRLQTNALVKDEAIRRADSGDIKSASSLLRDQSRSLQAAAPDAPAEQAAALNKEAENLRAKADALDAQGYTPGSRKAIQNESWQLKNAKGN